MTARSRIVVCRPSFIKPISSTTSALFNGPTSGFPRFQPSRIKTNGSFGAVAFASPRKNRGKFVPDHTGRQAERQITFLNFL
jgi:hypothetical protein